MFSCFFSFDSQELQSFQQERRAVNLKVMGNKYLPSLHFVKLYNWLLQHVSETEQTDRLKIIIYIHVYLYTQIK